MPYPRSAQQRARWGTRNATLGVLTLLSLALAPHNAYAQTYMYPTNSAGNQSVTSWKGSWHYYPAYTETLGFAKYGTGNYAWNTESIATNPAKLGNLRLVSDYLVAQTISGTVDWCHPTAQENGTTDCKYYTHIWVLASGSSTTARCTLVADRTDTGTEWDFGDYYGRKPSGAVSLTSCAISAGDRIVIEQGCSAANGTATSRRADIYYGGTSATLCSVGSDSTTTSYYYFTDTITSTPVRLASFGAERWDGASGTLISWRTGFEIENLGFYVHREVDGQRERVSQTLIPGGALFSGGRELTSGRAYSLWDENGQVQGARYWLEEVDLAGKRTWHGPIEPVHKPSTDARPRPVIPQFRGWDGASLLTSRPALVSLSLELPQARDAHLDSLHAFETQWSLASQPAIKLTIQQEGWTRVTRETLTNAGLNASTDLSKLRLFVRGRQIPLNALDNAIEFWATGAETLFTDTQSYWLIEDAGIAPLGVPITEAAPSGQLPVTSFLATVERKERATYAAAIKNGEAQNFFGADISSTPVTLSLPVPHRDPSGVIATLKGAVQGVTFSQHELALSIGDRVVGKPRFEGQTHKFFESTFPASHLKGVEALVSLRSLLPDAETGTGQPLSRSFVDGLSLTYARKYIATDGKLSASIPSGRWARIEGFSVADIRVFDVTDPSAPVELTGTLEPSAGDAGQYSVTIAPPGPGTRLVFAVAPKAFAAPVHVEQNSPSSWHGGSDNPKSGGADLVIIVPAFLEETVAPLRERRQRDGLSVAVVRVEDIYDEFNFGDKDPKAIKEFLKQATTDWKTPPRYVLFLGDATFDPRGYLAEERGQYDLIPTHFYDGLYHETASDDWFVDFDDNDLPDVAIGRLPARSVKEATVMIDKVIAHQGTADSVLWVTDPSDDNFQTNRDALQDGLPAIAPSMNFEIPGSGEHLAAEIADALSTRASIVGYQGHGSVDIWGGGEVSPLSGDTARAMKNPPALFVNMTCLNGFFHDLYTEESLAESLLNAPEGGAVAVWASSTLTHPEGQGQITKALLERLAAGSMALGEAVRLAKTESTPEDVRRSFILFGDPSMPLGLGSEQQGPPSGCTCRVVGRDPLGPSGQLGWWLAALALMFRARRHASGPNGLH